MQYCIILKLSCAVRHVELRQPGLRDLPLAACDRLAPQRLALERGLAVGGCDGAAGGLGRRELHGLPLQQRLQLLYQSNQTVSAHMDQILAHPGGHPPTVRTGPVVQIRDLI